MPASDTNAAVLQKIRSDELRREAVTAASQPHTVIIELDLPHPKLEAVSPNTRTAFGMPKFRIGPAPETASEIESRVANARHAIEQIIGKPPERFFSTSGSFVVTASGEQLRRIANLPSVSAIWPNTRR